MLTSKSVLELLLRRYSDGYFIFLGMNSPYTLCFCFVCLFFVPFYRLLGEIQFKASKVSVAQTMQDE